MAPRTVAVAFALLLAVGLGAAPLAAQSDPSFLKLDEALANAVAARRASYSAWQAAQVAPPKQAAASAGPPSGATAAAGSHAGVAKTSPGMNSTSAAPGGSSAGATPSGGQAAAEAAGPGKPKKRPPPPAHHHPPPAAVPPAHGPPVARPRGRFAVQYLDPALIPPPQPQPQSAGRLPWSDPPAPQVVADYTSAASLLAPLGALARAPQGFCPLPYSVLAYGAAGNGSADDAPSLAAADAALPWLYLPARTLRRPTIYRLASSITLHRPLIMGRVREERRGRGGYSAGGGGAAGAAALCGSACSLPPALPSTHAVALFAFIVLLFTFVCFARG